MRRGHVFRQIELRRGPCAQELLLGPADPELALACPLLVVADDVTQESLSCSLGWAGGSLMVAARGWMWQRVLWASPGQA